MLRLQKRSIRPESDSIYLLLSLILADGLWIHFLCDCVHFTKEVLLDLGEGFLLRHALVHQLDLLLDESGGDELRGFGIVVCQVLKMIGIFRQKDPTRKESLQQAIEGHTSSIVLAQCLIL